MESVTLLVSSDTTSVLLNLLIVRYGLLRDTLRCRRYKYLGARARAGGPASRGCPGRAAGREGLRAPPARDRGPGSSMAPSTEGKCTGRRVYSSSGYCMERMRCATRLATRYARYSLEPDVSASRVDAGALAGMPATRARTGEAGAARRGHRDGLPRCRGREAEAAARASRARPLTAPVS